LVAAAGQQGTIAAACAVACASLAFHQIFPWHELLAPIALAVCAPPLLSVAARHRAAWQALVVSVLAWALLAAPVVFHRAPSPGVATDTAHGLRDGWRTILATVLPLPRHPELLVVAYTAVWIAASATAELAVRTRAAAAPAVPPIVLLVIGGVLGAGGTDGLSLLVPVTAGTAATTMLVMAVRSRPRPVSGMRTAAGRRRVGADGFLRLGTIVVVTAAAAAAAPHLPLISGSRPFDPKRNVWLPPPTLQRAVSPLDEANAWLTQPARDLFSVRAASGAPWRLAVFDRFDGASWSTSARWAPTGGRVPTEAMAAQGPRTAAAAGPGLDQTVTISGLTGPWLPAAERPVQVSGVDVAVDPASGVIVTTSPLQAGRTYTVHSVPARPSPEQLRTAGVARDADAVAALGLPTTDSAGQTLDAYQSLLAHATTATAGARTPFDQATMLERYLRTEEHYDPTAPAGYSYRSLQDFLDTTHRGTTVQSAAAFVVMARTLGLPSRIAVGFRPGTPDGGTWRVTSSDVVAWPEVDFQGLGWVPFQPTPDGAATTPASVPPPTGPGDDPAKASQRPAESQPQPSGPAAKAPSAPSPGTASQPQTAHAQRLLMVALATIVLLGYVAVVPTAPARRRRRRSRRGTPAERIAGAWREAVDRLADVEARQAEQKQLSPLTTSEFARATAGVLDPPSLPHLSALAALVDAVAYAPAEPDAESAERAWRHYSALELAAARHLGWRRRWARRLVGRA
jgi:transglutaminase-like putative cysteine protease